MGDRAWRAGGAGVLRAIYSWLAAQDVSWAQELCIYMFIWMAKFGAAYGVRTGIHVGVDVLVNMLPPTSRKQVIVFSLLCGALFTGVVAVFGGSFVEQMYQTGQQSNDLEWPMWLPRRPRAPREPARSPGLASLSMTARHRASARRRSGRRPGGSQTDLDRVDHLTFADSRTVAGVVALRALGRKVPVERTGVTFLTASTAGRRPTAPACAPAW